MGMIRIERTLEKKLYFFSRTDEPNEKQEIFSPEATHWYSAATAYGIDSSQVSHLDAFFLFSKLQICQHSEELHLAQYHLALG